MAPPKTFPTGGLGVLQPPMADPNAVPARKRAGPYVPRKNKAERVPKEKAPKTQTPAQRRKYQLMGHLLPPEVVSTPDGWSEKWSQMILRYKRAGLTNEQCCMLIGVSEDTLQRYFPRELATGRLDVISQVANKLVEKALDGDTACMTFFLKTQAGWRETNRTELTGADGAPVTTAAITLDGRNLTPEERKVLRTALEAAAREKS